MNFRTKILLVIAVLCTLVVSGSFFLPKVSQAFTKASWTRPEIIVDPGHGGVDGGAVTADGIAEKDINLPLALQLRELLVLMGYGVIMTRETDISIHDPEYETIRRIKTSDLKNRMKIMEAHPKALFISIHQNKFSVSKYWGTQVFYSPNTPDSKRLADHIQQSVKTMLQPENSRVTKKSGKDIYLMYEAKSTAVLVECGFLSNPKEAALLKTPEYQNQLAFSILCGILEYAAAPPEESSSSP